MIKKIMLLVALFTIASMLIAGCSGKTDSSAQITLGAEYEDVVKVWGEPTRELSRIVDGHGLVYFKDDYYLAYFQEGRLASIIIQYEAAGGNVTRKVAEREAISFLPDDVKPLYDYEISLPPGTSHVYVYKSEALASMFEPGKFINADGDDESGLCITKYNFNEEGEVLGLLVAIGNNP